MESLAPFSPRFEDIRKEWSCKQFCSGYSEWSFITSNDLKGLFVLIPSRSEKISNQELCKGQPSTRVCQPHVKDSRKADCWCQRWVLLTICPTMERRWKRWVALSPQEFFFSKQVLSVFSSATLLDVGQTTNRAIPSFHRRGWLDVGMRRHRNVMGSCITLAAGRGYHLWELEAVVLRTHETAVLFHPKKGCTIRGGCGKEARILLLHWSNKQYCYLFYCPDYLLCFDTICCIW